jgi:hypothetical protein
LAPVVELVVVGGDGDGTLAADGPLVAVIETDVPAWLLSPMTRIGTADGAPSTR